MATATVRTVHKGAITNDRVTAKTVPLPTPAEVAQAMVRGVLVLLAVMFVAIGVTVLTSPAAVVFTVTLWLCAAVFAGLAVFGRFGD